MTSTPRRTGRGPHPRDRLLFAAKTRGTLREAVADLSWLRTRGYAGPSAIKLVGDRHRLTARQRTAVARCACGDAALASRKAREVPPSGVRDRVLLIDGFNLLTTLEAALAGGVLLRGRDGCLRDMSSMHGNYRVLDDTEAALGAILATLQDLSPGKSVWYLDRPVSNSGRLRSLVRAVAAAFPDVGLDVRLVKDPDPLLKRAASGGIVATADSGILDGCGEWVNLVDPVLARLPTAVEVLDLSLPPGAVAGR